VNKRRSGRKFGSCPRPLQNTYEEVCVDSNAKIDDAQNKLMSPMEAAEFLGVSRAQIYRIVARREIPAFKITPQAIRLWKHDVIAWLEDNPYA
jgi:excisionase family DNA binding protein